MKIRPKQYAQVLFQMTQGKDVESVSNILGRFVFTLRKKHHIKHIRKIISFFNELYNEKHNIIEVVVESASSLDDETKKRIEDYVRKTSPDAIIALKTKIIPTLQGGIVIRVGDQIIDGSIAKAVVDFRQYMRS